MQVRAAESITRKAARRTPARALSAQAVAWFHPSQDQEKLEPRPDPPPFIPYLHAHKTEQEGMRAVAGDEWQEHDALFTRPDGRPLDPRADWEEFKDLLAEAGIDDRRLYDGSRHTAGTILNELGVDIPTIMEILRHTVARRALSGVAAPAKSKSPRSRRVSPEASTEPPSGFEPETYALRVRCSGHLS